MTKRSARHNLPTRLLIKGLDLVIPLCLISLEIILNVLAVGTVVNGLLLVLIVTSPLWILLIICWWPVILAFACLLKFSSIRLYISKLITQIV